MLLDVSDALDGLVADVLGGAVSLDGDGHLVGTVDSLVSDGLHGLLVDSESAIESILRIWLQLRLTGQRACSELASW